MLVIKLQLVILTTLIAFFTADIGPIFILWFCLFIITWFHAWPACIKLECSPAFNTFLTSCVGYPALQITLAGWPEFWHFGNTCWPEWCSIKRHAALWPSWFPPRCAHTSIWVDRGVTRHLGLWDASITGCHDLACSLFETLWLVPVWLSWVVAICWWRLTPLTE